MYINNGKWLWFINYRHVEINGRHKLWVWIGKWLIIDYDNH